MGAGDRHRADDPAARSTVRPGNTRRRPGGVRGASEPEMTPEQLAEVEARIAAHAARVRAELERLGLARR